MSQIILDLGGWKKEIDHPWPADRVITADVLPPLSLIVEQHSAPIQNRPVTVRFYRTGHFEDGKPVFKAET